MQELLIIVLFVCAVSVSLYIGFLIGCDYSNRCQVKLSAEEDWQNRLNNKRHLERKTK